jgi:hypothetical protein
LNEPEGHENFIYIGEFDGARLFKLEITQHR